MNRFIFIVITLIFSSVVSIVLAYPKYQEFQAEKAELGLKEKELQNMEEHFSRVNTVFETLKKYKEELTKVDSGLPNTPSVPTLLDFVQKTVETKNLQMKNLSTSFITSLKMNEDDNAVGSSPEENIMGGGQLPAESGDSVMAGKIKDIDVDLTVFGSYEVFKSLLVDLEESARLIEIKDVSFSSSLEEGRNGYSFNIQLKASSY